jgi:hypothetical protein
MAALIIVIGRSEGFLIEDIWFDPSSSLPFPDRAIKRASMLVAGILIFDPDKGGTPLYRFDLRKGNVDSSAAS